MSESPQFSEVCSDSEKKEHETGAIRSDRTGKGRFDLIPPYALFRVALHYENGAVEHEDRNWEKGLPLMRYLESAFRHLMKLLGGSKDEDHAAAVIWNIMGYIETLRRIEIGMLPESLDNRPILMKGIFNVFS